MAEHPLPVGARVRHYGQQWAAARRGTATVREVKGPLYDGSYEYRVDATRDFSRRPGSDNPEDRSAWWSSEMTILATLRPCCPAVTGAARATHPTTPIKEL